MNMIDTFWPKVCLTSRNMIVQLISPSHAHQLRHTSFTFMHDIWLVKNVRKMMQWIPLVSRIFCVMHSFSKDFYG